jgi:uncharacterized membrane protein YphA (DoxX/SURF4 family)
MPVTDGVLMTDGVLAAGLVLVYLLDAVHWLEQGELAIESRRGSVVRIGFGTRWTLAGRRAWLPMPFTDTVAQRAQWVLEATRAAPLADASALLRWPARLSMMNSWVVALVAPACLLIGRQSLFVACALASWVLTLAAAAIAHRQRSALGCTSLQVIGSALLAMICLPCGGNLARAYAAHARGVVQLPAWAGALAPSLREPSLSAVREEFEYESTWVDEDSPRRAALTAALDSLRGRAP